MVVDIQDLIGGFSLGLAVWLVSWITFNIWTAFKKISNG